MKEQFIIIGNERNLSSWNTPRYFGIIPKPRYINVFSRRLAKKLEKFLNKKSQLIRGK